VRVGVQHARRLLAQVAGASQGRLDAVGTLHAVAEQLMSVGLDPSAPLRILPSVSKRSRQRTRGQVRPQLQASRPARIPPPDPAAASERLLLDQIAAGELDLHLTAIADAVRARYELLHTVSAAKALAMLNVGDRVRINHHASPRYLHGIQGNVVELDEHSATVCLHRPIGRFKSGEIRCPPLVLDRLNPAA
jgi:hypothetical protein